MTQRELLEQRQTLLDGFESSQGLPEHKPPGTENELQQYLNMNKTIIEALDASTAASIAVRLSQYAFYFQRTLGRQKSIKTWADAELQHITCKEIMQYDKYTPNKLNLVCMDNSAANELRQISLYAQQRIDRFEELASGIRNISYVIGLVFKSRMGDNK